MKRFFSLSLVLLVSLPLVAQTYYIDSKNPEILRHAELVDVHRTEIFLPMVNGYNVYKADLHTHTLYSDGSVMPSFRVQEAWQQGLDIIAITDHLESRRTEEVMVKYLEKYISDEYPEAVNTFIALEPTPVGSIMVDLNFGVRAVQKEAEKYGLAVIPGGEISRCGATIGHFNALFIEDCNLIYDPDPLTSIRNAKAQNALVMHNHPGYRRTSIDYSEVEKQAYAEGLIDGVEVMNGSSFYPGVIDRVHEKGLFIAACTDVHGANKYDAFERPMTLIFAKDKSLESIREALEARRTLAMGFNTLSGDEQLLKDFFKAGVKIEVIRKSASGAELLLTNTTPITYLIRQEGVNQKRITPSTSIIFKVGKGQTTLSFEVLNLFCGADKHPIIEYAF